jgi:hypothetical protein
MYKSSWHSQSTVGEGRFAGHTLLVAGRGGMLGARQQIKLGTGGGGVGRKVKKSMFSWQ